MNSRINFDGGYSIPQENEYQTRGTWISMIPDKPIQGRSHPIRVERQGNQLERGNWQELVGFPTGYLQETLNYNVDVSQFQSSDPNSLMSLNGGLCNWNVSLDQKNRLINHIAGPYTQDCSSDGTLAGILKISNTTSMASENSAVNRSIHAGIRPLNPYLHSQVNIDATSIASGNSTLNSRIRVMNRPLSPNTHSQVNSNWRVSNSASLFPNKLKNCSDSSPWCNDLLHIPQCGFPIPYPPRIERNASSSIINSFQFAPVTPEQTKSENQLSAIQTSPIDGTSSYKKGRPGNKAIEHHGDELLQNIVDSSSTAISTPVKEKNNNQGGDQGIDLNKTPQQKIPRRRKHRPKVIIEGKPKRASKPATRSPKSKENSSGKRKYVRKNGHKASETSKADVVGKTKDPAIQAAARSCRRALKFDLKKTTEENQGRLAGKTEEVQSGVNFNLNSDSQGTKLFRETDSNSGTKSAFHTGRQNGVIVGKWQAETTCKLTHSMNQMPFDYLSPPESRRAYPASLATTKVLQAESLNGVVNNINSGYADTSSHNNQKGSSSVHHQIHAEGIGQIVFQAKTTNDSFESRQLMLESAPQSMLKHLTDSNKARGHKRGYCHTVEETRPHTVNMMNFTLVCKERLQGHEENRSGRYLGEGLPGSHKKKKTENGLYTNTLSTLPSVTTAKEGSQQTKLNRGNEVDARQVTSQINQDILNSYVGNSSTPKNIINGSSKFASDWYSPSRAAGYNFPNQPNSSEVHLHTASMGEKRSTQVCDFISLTASKKGNLISHTPPKRAPTHVDGQGVETFSTDTPAKKQTVRHTVSKLLASGKDKVLPLQHEEVHGYQQSSTRRGPSGKKNLRIPIDDVICQLKALSINCRGNEIIGKEPKALVLYKGEGKIVPYEGFDHMKKHKPRPKVDLDPETDRIWKLLMGKEGSGSTEGTNKDKEKWWEEERSVFRGRADSFIARMHLVQGDRRFSKWKGSVVDSVIGVFLTQNVSDHLSSSAFMSLAARFPYKSTTNITTCYKERKNMLINEPEVRILDQDESIGLCGEVSGQPEYNQSSMRCLISRTKRKTVGEEHTWGVEGEIISPLDLFNSSIFQTNGGIQSCSRSYTEEDPATVCNLNEIHGSASRNLLQTEKTAMFQNKRIGKIAESRCNSNQWNGLMWSQEKPTVYPHALSWNYLMHQQSISHPGHEKENNQHSFNKNQHERARNFQFESTYETLDKIHNSHMHQIRKVSMLTQQTFDVEERISAVNKQQHLMNKETGPNSINQGYSSGKAYNEANTNTLKARSSKVEGEKKKTFDWDSLRKQVQSNVKRDRSKDTMDSLDYEALRCADVHEISNAIKERGMNNMLAERIKDFLNRLVSEHGSIDLEWLRDAPPDKTKDYLLSIRGLGLKSVECVRLLTLHHLAFPVDTNVGRIAVRLGWVPLQPLPESLQLHLLELYPILESIQKYLWPRLCKLDQRTLYELHYQMITFGKVFCTKNKPNCNACPMRGECRHFASAFASARLALPGPEENSIVNASIPIVAERNPAGIFTPMPLPAPEKSSIGEAISETSMCEPIIEVPATPEPECTEISESDIEDAFYDDPDEIPTINLNLGEFTLNLQNFMQENNLEIEDANISKALVALTPEAASIPTAKLKNVSRLRTEHEVYELPDTHPLLKGLERREPDDPSPYLLAIWTPGETENSTQPPERRCGSQDSNKLCNEKTCFSCNSIREANLQIVRGTLLIPCRTAMKGSFPLNGTYFQVNEVFADHDSSLNPIDVPRAWLWNLSRRTVYFGTSVSTIFKGLSTEGIQYCFWRGFVCVRGFDRKIGAPRPLMARLHFPASKLAKTRNERKGNGN